MNQDKKVVKISEIIESQIPEFILSENPNFSEFLKQYYLSQEYQGSTIDLAENLVSYKNIDTFDSVGLTTSTVLTSEASFFDETINVSSTLGWPSQYGLLKIDNEIITYTGITSTSFTGCIRGFSGVETLSDENNPGLLKFSSSEINEHASSSTVHNLSNLFLVEFFKKIKCQFTPGFEELDFDPRINAPNFVSKVKDFYRSKGTEEAFRILFKVLYGERVDVIKPKDFLFTPSDSKWIVVERFIGELLEGDPFELNGQTLYQNETGTDIISANGSIYRVSPFNKESDTFYSIDIFSGYSNNLNPKGSIFGKFNITPKTYAVSDVQANSDTIRVVSTLGFNDSGKLDINGFEITYSDKTNTEFIGCSGITTAIAASSPVYGVNYAYAYNQDGSIVKFRLLNTLSSIDPNNTKLSVEGDLLKVENIGITEEDTFTNSLLYNVPVSINAGKVLQTLPAGKYGISKSNGVVRTKYPNNLKNGDFVEVFDVTTNEKLFNSLVSNVNNTSDYVFSIENYNSLPLNHTIKFRRIPVTSQSSKYSNINQKYLIDIQSSYEDSDNYYVTSNGFPSGNIIPYERTFQFNLATATPGPSTSLLGVHNFYDGDIVVVKNYTTQGTPFRNDARIQNGLYLYVKKIDSNEIKLCYTKNDLITNSFINLAEYNSTGQIVSYVSSLSLSHSTIYNKDLYPSKLFKKIPKKTSLPLVKEDIEAGTVGVFVNGVEIQSPKSFDKIYYGPITSVDILNPGENYDLLNPPRFLVDFGSDGQTKLYPSLKGKISKVVVTNPGYDYIEVPTIEIKGGNNNNVKTEVKLIKKAKEITFNANDSSVVNTLDPFNNFVFNENHRLMPGDSVVYKTFGNEPIGVGTEIQDGFLSDNGVYYISKIGVGNSFSLFPTYDDAIAGINTINIRSRGKGIQKFVTVKEANIVDEVIVVDDGGFFEIKTLPFTVSDVNKYDNIISIKNHGFNDKEEVSYGFVGVSLNGLSTNSYYYIKKIDDDRFKLYSNANLSGNPVDINFDNSHTSSVYTISYSPIRVNIYGKLTTLGISQLGFQAEVYPVVTGEITDVRVSTPRTYGNVFLNIENPPSINLVKGSNCYLKPIISNGKIIDVIVLSSGSGYHNRINIKINGKGIGAELHPVINDGQIVDVRIVRSGVNYDNFTTLEIEELGNGAFFQANLNYWNVNEVSKYSTSILNNGLLIESDLSNKSKIGIYYLTDQLSNSLGITTTSHSPIIGWAFDGCPIYGPYSYQNNNGTGRIIKMTSSYRLRRVSPVNVISPNLNCIEDYVYEEGLGTLDEHNGRYCVTPEFPNGVYAYFSTDTYPFFIGPKFKYSTVKENFLFDYNQNIDVNELGLIKHTHPYYIQDLDNYYEYFDFYPSLEKEDFKVSKVQSGSVDGLEVIYSGSGYKIDDRITFDNTGTSGSGARAVVSELEGVGVSSITSNNLSYQNITFINSGSSIVGISTENLELKDDYFINISNLPSGYEKLNGLRRISFDTFNTRLAEAIPSNTGIVTSIKIEDSITNLQINSALDLGTETLIIVGFDYLNNRINVSRSNQSISHSIQSIVNVDNNRFSFENNLNIALPPNDEIYYFDSELISVGIGTTPGSGNTLVKYPLGLGVSESKFVRTAGIWMPNHKFISGEKVNYSFSNNDGEISTSVGNLSSIQNLYIVDLGNSIIGFVSESSDINNLDRLIYFTNNGSGNTHKLKTNRSPVSGSISYNETTVRTVENHNLSVNDVVTLSCVVGNTRTFTVSHSPATSRILINSSINPKLNVYRNETVVFDLSSSSVDNATFKLYTDERFENEYLGETINDVYRSGDNLYLNITSKTPSKLYYNLSSDSLDINIDTSISGYSTIDVLPSAYNSTSNIVGISSNYFVINLPQIPERNSYVSIGNTVLSYSINQSTATGPIKTAKMQFKGSNYKKLPSIVSIGNSGVNAKLYPVSDTVGKILKIDPIVSSIYPSDKTLKPSSNLYSVLYLKDNYKVDEIRVVEGGKNYLSAPIVKLYNVNTNQVYPQFTASCEMKNSSVEEIIITDPGSGIPEEGNKLVFTENSNGIKILEVTKQQISPGIFTVSLRLETPLSGFTTSNPLPFEQGDEIFIEGVISSGNGYNSEFYSYDYFDVVSVVQNYSSQDQAIVRYNVNGDPGIPISLDSAYVINKKDVPVAEVDLAISDFYPNEFVKDSVKVVNNSTGETNKNYLKVYDANTIELNEEIVGNVSRSKGTVVKIENYESNFVVSESFSKELGSIEDRGYLSSGYQKIQDNEYYQNFSYSLRSNIEINDWNSPVSDLAHISGFKKFSDLQIESVGVTTLTANASSIVNISLDSYVNVNTINDIDLVLEDVDENENLFSEKLKFNTIKLSDYILSRENRVLSIDDISNNFDNDGRFAKIIIDILQTFGSGSYIAKYFVFVESTTSIYTDYELPTLVEIYLAKNGNSVNIISYSYFEDDFLGDFIAEIDPENSDQVLLSFVPFNINNIISVRTIKDTVPLDQQVTTENYGNVSNITRNNYYAAELNPTIKNIELISINDCNSGNLYVGIGTTNGHITEFIELSFVHNGQDITSNIYSDTEIKDLGIVGIAITNNNVAIQFEPVDNTDTYVYINAHLLRDINVNPSEIILDNGRLNSSSLQFVANNLNPVAISTITSDYSATKYVVEVQKTVGVTTETNLIQINSVHYTVTDLSEKYLNNIDYGLIGNYDDLEFETIFDPGSQSYSLVYYPKTVGADYTIRFYEKSILRATNPLLL